MIDRCSAMLTMAAAPALAHLKFQDITIFEARKIVTMSQSLPFARFMAVADAVVIALADTVGSLAAGKKADFVVLNHDPFEIETAALKEMPIMATVFEGRTAG